MNSREPDPIPSFGEAACPACGYVRTGVDHRAPCPECGGEGFAGELLVFGGGDAPVGLAWHEQRQTLVRVVGLVAILAVLPAAPSFVPGLPSWLRSVLAYSIVPPMFLGIFALMLGWNLLRSWRARGDESSTGAVWQVTREGIVVRERAGGRYLAPTGAILRIDAIGGEGATIVRVVLNPLAEPARSFRLRSEPRTSVTITVEGDPEGRDRLLPMLGEFLRVPIRRRQGLLDEGDADDAE